MSGRIQFNRDYAAFGSNVEPHEITDDVGRIVSYFMWFEGFPFYGSEQLIGAKIAGIWLGDGERPAGDINNIDLLFRMGGTQLTEIVLRSSGGPAYGGYVFGDPIEVTDEIVNGHRVLVSSFEGDTVRYVYDPNFPDLPQYAPEGSGVRADVMHRLRKQSRGR